MEKEYFMNKLDEFIEEFFGLEDNEINRFISERGNQRIEIKDKHTGEIWHTLECVEPIENMDDFTDIEIAIIQGLLESLNNEEE